VWFDHLKAEAAAKVSVALTRLESGNFSNVSDIEHARACWQDYKRRKTGGR
jgi:hypothetical protein